MEFFEKYYTYALKYLSYRPRSEKELRDALLKRKASLDVIEKIILLLQEQRFLSDEEFVKWWIEQRKKFKLRSKRVIALELRQKGISQQLITTYLTDDEKTAVNDLEQALLLVKKKLRRYQHLSKEEVYQKLGGSLMRQGFSYDTVKRAIDICLKGAD